MKNKFCIVLIFSVNLLLCLNLYSQLTTKWDLKYLDTRYILSYRIYEDGGNVVNPIFGQFFGEIPFDAIDEKNIVLIDKSNIFTVDSLGSFDEVIQNASQSFHRLRIIKSSDGGINWYTIYPDTYENYSNQAITSIQYLNNNWIFFCGRTILHKNKNNLSEDTEEFTSITYTSDGGKNWVHRRIDTTVENENKRNQYVTNIKMIDSINGFAIINSHNNYIDYNFKFISTNNCWQNYKIEYFTKYDSSKTQRASSLDIYKTKDIDSTVVAITDTRGYLLISTDKGKQFRSIKISNFFPKQVKILNENDFLVLGIDSTVQDVKEKPQKGKYKVIKFNNKNDSYQIVYVNLNNEKTSDIFKYNEQFISIISGGKLLMSKDGGLNWQEQDITPFYIKYAKEKKVFALSGAYLKVPNTLENGIHVAAIALYSTSGDSTLKKPNIFVNNKLVSNSTNNLIDSTFCMITWNSIIGANYYFLKIYGEHIQTFNGSRKTPYYLTNKKDNVWKKDEVIQILTKDTSYLFQNIKRNMLYSIELYSLSSSDTLKSLPSIALFKSDTSNLAKPDIFNPINNSLVNTTNVLVQWHPVEGASGYNIEVGLDGMNFNKAYQINLKVKNYKNTSYLLYDLEPNKIYYIAISTMNDDDISDWQLIYFSTESILSASELFSGQTIPFPNPARSSTRLNLQQDGDISITAIDVLGRSYTLWSGYASSGEKELDVSTLSSGSYTLLINYGTKVEIVRLIRE